MFRKTSNMLLSKDDVGKSKPSMRTLPDPEFSYGQPVPKETDGVGRRKLFHCIFDYLLHMLPWSSLTSHELFFYC
jgi:hypothetical protein